MRGGGRRRRAAAGGGTGHSMFGSTGWLFADLLLALALAFLLAATFAAPSHPKASNPHPSPTKTVKPTATPTHRKTGQPEPALDLNYVTVHLTNLSASSIEQVITNNPRLNGERAGLVIIFAGGPSSGGDWGQVDSQVWSTLQGMDSTMPLFKVAVSRQFWDGTLPQDQVTLNVYLFKTS